MVTGAFVVDVWCHDGYFICTAYLNLEIGTVNKIY